MWVEGQATQQPSGAAPVAWEHMLAGPALPIQSLGHSSRLGVTQQLTRSCSSLISLCSRLISASLLPRSACATASFSWRALQGAGARARPSAQATAAGDMQALPHSAGGLAAAKYSVSASRERAHLILVKARGRICLLASPLGVPRCSRAGAVGRQCGDVARLRGGQRTKQH